MYGRMLDKLNVPTREDMAAHCGVNGEQFALLNDWLSNTYGTSQKIVFPYGNRYGWAIAHYRKKKSLVCNVFAEEDAFTVMLRLSNQQCGSAYSELGDYAREYIDKKYPCGNGGWIHYRVSDKEHLGDLQTLLSLKCKG